MTRLREITDLPAAAESVRLLLADLAAGGTVESVTARLVADRCRGEVADPARCPLARWLRARTRWAVLVAPGGRAIRRRNAGPVSAPPPGVLLFGPHRMGAGGCLLTREFRRVDLPGLLCEWFGMYERREVLPLIESPAESNRSD